MLIVEQVNQFLYLAQLKLVYYLISEYLITKFLQKLLGFYYFTFQQLQIIYSIQQFDYKEFIEVKMKNKRKNATSSDRQNSKEDKNNKSTHRNQRAQRSTSVMYETSRNSLGYSSPRHSKNLEKYKTYIQFITNNKITNESCPTNRQEVINMKKDEEAPPPRKNSPVPYSKGRRSAFSKLTQPTSPSQMAFTQRNSFPKCRQNDTKKQNNPNLTFVVRGNNPQKNNGTIGNQRKKISIMQNKKQLGHRRQTSRDQQHSNYKADEKKQKNSFFNHNSKAEKKNNEKKSKKTINKSSIESQYQQKLQKQEAKLFERLFQGIQFYRDLGRGAHALVKSAVDWNQKRKIAVKIYDKSQLTNEQVKSIQRQIEILMSINHLNIVKLYQIIETFKTINLIMQYGGGNSLDQYIKSKPEGHLSQKEAKLIFRQVLEAVKYLHEKDITHRDIKPENILLNKHLSLKIIDFGFSLKIKSSSKNIDSYCGTPTYMAPQVVSKTPHNPFLSDRWSLGILLYTMLNGHCPFRASTQKQLFSKIKDNVFEHTKEVNPQAKDLIKKFLKNSPTERLSPKQALQHSWVLCE